MKRNNVILSDYALIAMILSSVLISVVLFYLNHVDFHFPIVRLFTPHFTTFSKFNATLLVLLSTLFLSYGIYIREESPRSATFIWGLGSFFWCTFASIVLSNAIQSTPFPPIDPWLLKIDRLMGVHTSALMTWTHNHPFLLTLFNNAYGLLVIELVAIPILLMIFHKFDDLTVFFISAMSTMIIGSLIYYFFPTTAPSGIVHSAYFSHAQQDTSTRFYQIHHFLKPTSSDGGLIAFPSFHVIWAVLLTFASRKKVYFYPVLLLNVIIIASTVFLGWHYLTDVISGVLLAAGGIALGYWMIAQDQK